MLQMSRSIHSDLVCISVSCMVLIQEMIHTVSHFDISVYKCNVICYFLFLIQLLRLPVTIREINSAVLKLSGSSGTAVNTSRCKGMAMMQSV